MIYKFRLISNEEEDFVMDIGIGGTANFLDLHQFLQSELGYDKSQLASFFITDHEWNKVNEITLLEMGTDDTDQISTMENTVLADFIVDNKQRMLYVFDLFSERGFFMELFGIEKGNVDNPFLLQKNGTVPVQMKVDMNKNNFDSALEEFEIEEDLDELYKYNEDFDDPYNISDLPDDEI